MRCNFFSFPLFIRLLSFHTARHSVATILSNKLNTSVDDVAICLNHVDPNKAITLTYIRTDFSKVDNANRKFIEYILEVAKKEKESINQKENTTFNENQKQCVQRKKLHSERTKLERLII